ncbi:MAG: UDP-N-acetylglucosamine 2-epimerase [Saprospiraceae bacterium]|nr:UDP-N-acetylglucosamine 2-epimerase [Saprospiraceae bacterium]
MDKFFETEYLPKEEVTTNIGMTIKGNDKYCVLIQHPIINEVEEQSKHIRHTLDAILESGMKCFINYPNSDAGYFPIIEAYNEYTSKFSNLKLFNNLDRVNYINLLRYASCLLGNSSSGILEAPTLHLPVINIGNRQRGRFSSNNVIFVDNDKEQIIKAINKALYDSEFISLIKNTPNPYGDEIHRIM